MSPAPHPGLTAARAPRAVGPGSDTEALRRAYLDLLKLCLCDLTGAGTAGVGRGEAGVLVSRELTGDQLRVRAAGMDWPLHGLSMIGLNRLDDLQSCVESVVREGVDGDWIEAGAWRGGASILARATLDSLGDREREVWVADSFQGFPATDADPDHDEWAVIDFLAVPLGEVEANFARLGCERGVRFVPGFFEDTLPGLSGRRWSVIRLDGDTYEATMVALRSLYPGLAAGGHLIVDDYGALEGCQRAVDEFRREAGITEPLEEVDWTCVRWRRESDQPIAVAEPAKAAPHADGRARDRAVKRRPGARVPTGEELELSREIAALRERLEAAQAEAAWLRGSPLRGPREWVQHALGALRGRLSP